ncbi:hypothetical protein [Ureibacillus acetophenoni]|uniref:hypothetical protein n=1 Tax=Ureibacillus acetophenoni TaxID=614649 RepID=UPI001142D565|nr:hypothetical protein [Ureibacillus acetophenoni]
MKGLFAGFGSLFAISHLLAISDDLLAILRGLLANLEGLFAGFGILFAISHLLAISDDLLAILRGLLAILRGLFAISTPYLRNPDYLRFLMIYLRICRVYLRILIFYLLSSPSLQTPRPSPIITNTIFEQI